jgi:hypothetical protein
MLPLKAGEPTEISVGGYPDVSGFYGQSGEIGIRDQIALGFNPLAEAYEDLPMSGPRQDEYGIRMMGNLMDELNGDFDRGWGVEHFRVGNHPQKAAHDKCGNTEGAVVVEEIFNE